jgi:hypothetical protein
MARCQQVRPFELGGVNLPEGDLKRSAMPSVPQVGGCNPYCAPKLLRRILRTRSFASPLNSLSSKQHRNLGRSGTEDQSDEQPKDTY